MWVYHGYVLLKNLSSGASGPRREMLACPSPDGAAWLQVADTRAMMIAKAFVVFMLFDLLTAVVYSRTKNNNGT
jgi:hypothetical protein